MLYEDHGTRESLRKIVCRISRDPALNDDLMQEGIIHLWMIEASRPEQTSSWYLQSCQFHLLNYMQSGRSMDAAKRCARRAPLPPEDTETATIDFLISDAVIFSE